MVCRVQRGRNVVLGGARPLQLQAGVRIACVDAARANQDVHFDGHQSLQGEEVFELRDVRLIGRLDCLSIHSRQFEFSLSHFAQVRGVQQKHICLE